MYLKRISISDFKNIENASALFSPQINCIYGSNGQGKTNLLDAVHYLSMTKSFFSPSDQYSYRFGTDAVVITGEYIDNDNLTDLVSVAFSKSGDKKVHKNRKAYTRFSEHIGTIPVVMISPFDTALVNDSGESRRRFANTHLCQTDRLYTRHLQNYNQLLARRNRILKDDVPDPAMIDVLTMQMAPCAEYIYEVRKKFCSQINEYLTQYYSELCAGGETVSISYESDLDKADFEALALADKDKERALRYTCSGVHRDDFIFSMDGHSIKRCGSQGQQKSFLIALKLAQQTLMKSQYGFAPILLLDDLFDKLDMQRVEYLLRLVSGAEFGQIFITDCNKVRLEHLAAAVGAECAFFNVEAGVITRTGGEEDMPAGLCIEELAGAADRLDAAGEEDR